MVRVVGAMHTWPVAAAGAGGKKKGKANSIVGTKNNDSKVLGPVDGNLRRPISLFASINLYDSVPPTPSETARLEWAHGLSCASTTTSNTESGWAQGKGQRLVEDKNSSSFERVFN